jgi:hypothetical protein
VASIIFLHSFKYFNIGHHIYSSAHILSQSAIAKSREKQQINVRKTIDSGRVDVCVKFHHQLSIAISHQHFIRLQIERHIKIHEDFVGSKQRKIEADCQTSRDKFTSGLQAIEQKVVSSTEKFEAEISRAVKDKRTLKKAYKVIADFQFLFKNSVMLYRSRPIVWRSLSRSR